MHSCLMALDLSTAPTGSILNFVYVCMESSVKKILFVNDHIGNVKFNPNYLLTIKLEVVDSAVFRHFF